MTGFTRSFTHNFKCDNALGTVAEVTLMLNVPLVVEASTLELESIASTSILAELVAWLLVGVKLADCEDSLAFPAIDV